MLPESIYKQNIVYKNVPTCMERGKPGVQGKEAKRGNTRQSRGDHQGKNN